MYQPPLDAALGRTPMFAGDHGYQVQGPFNFGGDSSLSPLLTLGANMVLPQLMSRYNMTPGQFLPTQNLHDQFLARQQQLSQLQASQMASSADRSQLQATIAGGMRLATGRELTQRQQQQAFGMAGQLSSATPYLSMLLGPEIVDAMHGPRGSATIMSQGIHRGMRYGYDPITGSTGGSGRSAGVVSQQLFTDLYGPGANLSEMRGMSAGQAGALYEEMAIRGYNPAGSGRASLASRMADAGRLQLSDQDIAGIAERSDRIRGLRDAGKPVTDDDYAAARQDVRATQARMRSGDGDAMRDLDRPGAEDLLRVADARRIGDRLKNMAGAVAAMREIFGDNGRPNAPMREIVNGLEALSQGNMANMSPGKLENLVRTTQVAAKQSGLGIQGFLGLQAQASGLADRLGLDRSLAATGTQSSAFFAAAAGASGKLGGFGGVNKEEAALLDTQLRMTAANSQTANQMNATIRLFKEGVVTADSELGKRAQALMSGQDVAAVNDNEWAAIAGRSGVNAAVGRQVLRDTFANQEYGRDYKTADLARRKQYDLDFAPRLAQAAEGSLLGTLRNGGVRERMRAAGVTRDAADELAFSREVAEDLPASLRTFSPEAMKDTSVFNREVTAGLRTSISSVAQRRERAKGKRAGETDADFERRVSAAGERAVGAMGGDMNQAGVGLVASVNEYIRTSPMLRAYKSWRGASQMQDRTIDDDMRSQEADARATVAMQSSLSGLGMSGPIARAVGALQNARPGDDPGKLLMTILGGIDNGEMAKRSPVRGVMDAVAEHEKLDRDATGHLTPAGLRKASMLSTATRGLVEGGRKAEQGLAGMTEELLGKGGRPEDLDKWLKTRLEASNLSNGDRETFQRYLSIAQGLRQAIKPDGGAKQILEAAGYRDDAAPAGAGVDGAGAAGGATDVLMDLLKSQGVDITGLAGSAGGGMAVDHIVDSLKDPKQRSGLFADVGGVVGGVISGDVALGDVATDFTTRRVKRKASDVLGGLKSKIFGERKAEEETETSDTGSWGAGLLDTLKGLGGDKPDVRDTLKTLTSDSFARRATSGEASGEKKVTTLRGELTLLDPNKILVEATGHHDLDTNGSGLGDKD